jgi:hypothetical protein
VPPPDHAVVIAHERDQFYLYYVMRLVPLRSPGFQITALEADPARQLGLRVSSPGRRDVNLYFDDGGRLARLVTRVVDPGAAREVIEELRFSGTIEGQGVRWPRKIAITWDGRPYFDFELTEFTPVRTLDPRIFSAPD